MWATVIAKIVGLLVKLGLKKKQESDKQRADAVEKTVESVGESLDLEKDVRDAQDEVDKDEKIADIVEDDGGLNFDAVNEDAKKREEEAKKEDEDK